MNKFVLIEDGHVATVCTLLDLLEQAPLQRHRHMLHPPIKQHIEIAEHEADGIIRRPIRWDRREIRLCCRGEARRRQARLHQPCTREKSFDTRFAAEEDIVVKVEKVLG